MFEVVGTYFVSNFYHVLHMKARESVNDGHHSSVTTAYRAIVAQYASAIDNDSASYKKMVQRLHEFYEKHKGPTALKKFENSFVSHFIPMEFFRSMTDSQRDAAFREILLYGVKAIGNKMVSKQMIARITDDHAGRAERSEDVSSLQEFMVTTFMIKREDYYEKFTAGVINGSRPPTVSVEIVERLKAELISVTKQKCSLQEDLDRTLNIIENLRVRIDTSTAETATATAEIARLNSSIADMRSRAERIDRERAYQLRETIHREPSVMPQVMPQVPTAPYPQLAQTPQHVPITALDESESESSEDAPNQFILNDDPWE